MKKMTIFKNIRSSQDYSKIIGKETLRVINVSATFEGIGKDDTVNKAAFQSLANDLEPYNDGITIS